MSICPHRHPSGPPGPPERHSLARLGLSPSIPLICKRLELGLPGGRYTRARKARRWSRAKVIWEMSIQATGSGLPFLAATPQVGFSTDMRRIRAYPIPRHWWAADLRSPLPATREARAPAGPLGDALSPDHHEPAPSIPADPCQPHPEDPDRALAGVAASSLAQAR